MGCGHLSYGNPYNGNPSPWMDWPSPNMAQAQHGSTINRDPKWLSPKTEWFAVHSTNYSKVVNLIRPNKRLFAILPEIGWYQPSKTWGLQHWVLLHCSFSNPKKQMLLLPTSFQVELLLVAQIPWRMARPKKDPIPSTTFDRSSPGSLASVFAGAGAGFSSSLLSCGGHGHGENFWASEWTSKRVCLLAEDLLIYIWFPANSKILYVSSNNL